MTFKIKKIYSKKNCLIALFVLAVQIEKNSSVQLANAQIKILPIKTVDLATVRASTVSHTAV